MMQVFGKPRVLDVVAPIQNNGKLFASVHVGVHTSLLRAVYDPLLRKALWLMSFALIAALLAAFSLSNLALRPMTEISRQLDRLTAAGGAPVEEKRAGRQDVAAQVSTKIEKIGQRMRNVEEVYSALRENLDQILGNLQDGIMLFTEDTQGGAGFGGGAAIPADRSREHSGASCQRISRRLESAGPALCARRSRAAANMVKEEIRTEGGRRIQASVEFINDAETQQGLGALVMLHDLESAAEIESELELSRRMAAIGRLTSGVGHEVKNPINAIVVHLELLKSKLGASDGPAARHLDVIDVEIRRLDRVVQTLVDFARPVEVQLREQDLRPIIGDVLALASDELTMRRVTLISRIPAEPLIANVDADLLKQAVLNVIQNGAQAMPNGGLLEVTLELDSNQAESQTQAAKANGTAGAGLHLPASFGFVADCRPRHRNSRRNPRQDLRSVLHDQDRGQRHRAGNDLSDSAIASWQRRSTIEAKARHGIPAANSTRRRRQGTPESAAGGCRRHKGDGEMKSPARCAAWLLPFLLTGCIHTPFHKNQPAQLIMAPPIPHTQPMELASVELPPAIEIDPRQASRQLEGARRDRASRW